MCSLTSELFNVAHSFAFMSAVVLVSRRVRVMIIFDVIVIVLWSSVCMETITCSLRLAFCGITCSFRIMCAVVLVGSWVCEIIIFM